MPRVLHVVHGHPAQGAGGGTERYVRAIAAGAGAPVLTRDRRADAPPGLQRTDLGDHALWSFRAPARSGFEASWRCPEAEAALVDVVRQERAEVVHVHHLAHLDLGLPRTARELGAAVVLTLHDYHLACARGQLVDRDLKRCAGPAPERCARCLAEHLRASGPLARLAPLVRRVGLESAGRRALAGPAPRPRDVARSEARAAAARQALAAAHRVLAPSRSLAERFGELGLCRSVVVQDLPLVSPIPPAPAPPPGPVRFLFVGSLIPTKGPGVLVEAFALLRSMDTASSPTLTLYGPRPAYDGRDDFHEALLRRLTEVGGARWAGLFGDEARAQVYAEADVLVVPSTWEENSPLVVREAVAAGLRVVASDVGGVAEVDPDARRVPPGDPRALAEALRAEVDRGRGRRPTRPWPLAPHLSALEIHYLAAMTARGDR
ncbi:MAG: glycosyltransferase [Alphaproteobacteria bacterium]|nr:glycosyltransferase [Alphaproteobacteria bacterium]